MDDAFWSAPQAPYDERRRLFLDYAAPHSAGGHVGFFSQIARLELGRDPVDEAPVREALAYVHSRQDCSDFTIAGLLRILYRYRDSPLLSRGLVAGIEDCVLGFKYWWDEPGTDPMCYWTENHQILFHADELLAGQLFRRREFRNTGTDGRTRMAHALPWIERWFTLRAQLGFSEWLSNCYFDEDLLALVNLRDFAEDADIRRRAEQFIHLLLFEMALHSYQGVFGCTHGRTYADMIMGGRREPTSATAKLMLGVGCFNDFSSLSAVALATSGYRCPAIIEAVATDSRPSCCRERHGIEVEEAPRYGLSYNALEDGTVFWGMGAYVHPRILPLSMRMVQEYRIYEYAEFQSFVSGYKDQMDTHADLAGWAVDKTALAAVHIETLRTADYLLSCAQDYRPGTRGYQQHIWQATLGPDAVVFTNHPGADDETSRPNYWAGNGCLPRAVQYRNLVICIHRVPGGDPFPFSHLYFPRAAFDEVAEQSGWVCARKQDGYVAVRSEHPLQRPESGPYRDVELRADSPSNIWLCELGASEQWRDFTHFVRAVASSAVECEGGNLAYQSPSLGWVEFGWEAPLRVQGSVVQLRDYKRFDNPYADCEFGDTHPLIRRDGEELQLDLDEET